MVEFYNVVDKDYINLCKQQVLDVRIKVELLDHYEHTIGEVTTKVSSTSGSISVKYNQGVRRTCDITIDDINKEMLPNNENSVFFVNKKFKIYIGLCKKNWSKSGSDGTGVYHNSQDDTIYWFSQGIFITQSCDYDKKNGVLHLSGVDKFGFFTKDLNQHTLQNTYHISADSKLGQLISDIITIDMGNGMPTDTQTPIIHTSFVDQVLPYDIEKTANETIGDILVEIATAFNADIYYDVDGHLVFEPNIIDDYNRQAPVFEFGKNDSALIDMSLDFNYGDIINQITVTGDNSDGVVYSSTATNENPISSLRVSNIGIKAADIEETAMGYSDKRCSDYANYLLKKKMRMAIAGTITCTPLPHLDCNRIVKVYQNEEDVNEIDLLIEEIQIPLSPEAYSLSVCNIQDLPLTCYTSMIPQSALSEWLFFKDSSILGKYISKGSETFVVVPSNIDGKNVMAIGGDGTSRPLEDRSTISYGVGGLNDAKTIYIENGIKTINSHAFCGIYSNTENSLEKVVIPNSIVEIGERAFMYCRSLKNINLSENLTSIKNRMFDSCNNLTNIIIPNSITEIGDMVFYYCNSLSSVSISDNLARIKTCAFYDCESLVNIYIPDNVSKIEGGVFGKCVSLERINVSQNNESYCDEDGVLFNKSKSTLIKYPANKNDNSYSITTDVESIGNGAFSDCKNLVDITIPNSVVNFGYGIFANCTNLETVSLPNNIKTLNKYIQYSDYDNNSNYRLGMYMGGFFSGCTSLSTIEIPDSISLIGDYTFESCSSLENVTIPDGVMLIGDYAFARCSSLTNITIPSAVCLIGSQAFVSSAIIAGQTDCHYVGGWLIGIANDNITSCEVTEGTKGIAENVFARCKKLESVVIPDSIENIGCNAFNNTVLYKNQTDSIKYADTWVIDCNYYIVYANIKSGTKGIADKAFYYKNYMQTVLIPNSVIHIGNHAFWGCSSLRNIIIPNSVTSIGMGAFSDCLSISEIIIPQSVTEIKLQAFANCEKLERIIFQNPECKIYDCEDTICNGYTYKNDPDNTVDSSCHEFIIDNNRMPYFTGIICGYENSTAQEYAEKYNRTFVAITETE